ncbi:glucan ABC transporter ATP-binding protein/ permease [Bdellovibrio sp. SKB1291214]|uniref:glucan ABC transporter ATP-binding protein/ permease n=1 Tax=Bdellovibrio sp. SKB1291214 TaxID=1732569 RepID=UPI00224014A1|nr:glucan ABC transporter ATP-binding protein/ permease [Bdellovibrio sp. SKB1291214]UYL07282.1 glucan ABC transporter ATP-binding protein/ permease [Bdellovibrio sp. SKB1291214]
MTLALLSASVFVGFVQVAEPVLFGRVIDSLTRNENVFSILAFWGLLGIINILTSVFLAVLSDRLAHRQRLGTLDLVFERVIGLPVSYHSEQGSGRMVRSILSGTDQLFHLWLSFMREHASSLIGIILLIPMAITLDRRMAALLFVLALIYAVANFLIVKKTHSRQAQVETYHQNLFARIGDVLGNVTVVQSYARLWDEIKSMQTITAQLLNEQYPILTWWGILAVITRVSSTLTMVSILILGSYLVQKNEMTVGQVVAFTSFSGLLIAKLEQISSFLSRTISQAPSLQTFFQLLDQPDGAQEHPNAKAIEPQKGEVRFQSVTYNYKNSTQGVFDINFTAGSGQTVALVGPSGSGKTTTLALLQRLFDPNTGNITIDGEDIRHFTLTSLRHSIATVFQDAGLFNRSVAENIRIGRPTATDEEVHQAAIQADAHDFIMSKPGGYEFVIGERGSALSGGERQRLAIARAILKNAPILIFDEATSALDYQTEKKIQHAIENLRAQNKTTFVIAHRLSTVIEADLILVFKNGRIIESGNFQELCNRNGLFTELVKLGELKREPHLGEPHATG